VELISSVQNFLIGEGYNCLRIDGDVQQAHRQKSIDAFNAPDSEYFIFLLTTRAGGVGINLATADTGESAGVC
jgi:SNF2 family DNA or RNA helicase